MKFILSALLVTGAWGDNRPCSTGNYACPQSGGCCEYSIPNPTCYTTGWTQTLCNSESASTYVWCEQGQTVPHSPWPRPVPVPVPVPVPAPVPVPVRVRPRRRAQSPILPIRGSLVAGTIATQLLPVTPPALVRCITRWLSLHRQITQNSQQWRQASVKGATMAHLGSNRGLQKTT